ncbi:MAG: hypothetical protein JSS21_08955 [Proteobacteria bacterium]|nr:hypothetical protein [Pseudomonadota bacterium]
MPAHPERDIPEHPVREPEPPSSDGQPFDAYGHALLREIRGREPPHERWRRWFALLATIVFHIVLVVLVVLEMRPRLLPPPVDTRGNAIAVNLYESPQATAAAPAPPPIELPPLRTREVSPRQTRVEPHNPNAITATIGESQPTPKLYGKQGQALLPPPSSVASTPEYAAPTPTEPGLMQHSTPLPYESTRFNKDWAPDKESLGAKAFRRAVDATTAVKTIRLPGGIKIKCGVSPLLLAAGCGPMPPPPPPKNDDDPRLSLPPAVSLTGQKISAPAAPSTSAQPAKAGSAPKPAGSSPW